MRKNLAIFLSFTLLLLGSGCALTRPATTVPLREKSTIKVVATIPPLADITRQIGGNLVEITTLLPPGSSPHSFEPVPEQVKSLAQADLLIQIGAGLDDWAGRLSQDDKKIKRIILTQGLRLLEEKVGTYGHAENPHIWLDPVIVRDHIAPEIKKALAELAPPEETYFEANLNKFQMELTQLDNDIKRSLSRAKQKNFIAFHPAWSYFAARYGLKEVGVIQEVPEQEPAPRQLANLIALAKTANNPPILLEPQFNPKIGQLLAAEYEGRVFTLDPLGAPDTDYLELMRSNLTIWEKALEIEPETGGKK
ncbi:MAG: zinc transport system substrate-binding protein [Clostridia bacterium]|nr:zinc transport system substrate-binding protein [Clostridia bacterium]